MCSSALFIHCAHIFRSQLLEQIIRLTRLIVKSSFISSKSQVDTRDNELHHVSNTEEPDADAAWETLKHIFEAINEARALYLSNKLSNIKMMEFTTIEDFIKRVKKSIAQLSNVRDSVTDAIVV